MITDRMTVNVHDSGEFHPYYEAETGEHRMVAERMTEYTLGDLPSRFILHSGGEYTLIERNMNTNYYTMQDGTTHPWHFELTPHYTPVNTAVVEIDGEAHLRAISVYGASVTIAVRNAHNREVQAQVSDISSRYAELLLSTHENYGELTNLQCGVAIQCHSPGHWEFMVLSQRGIVE